MLETTIKVSRSLKEALQAQKRPKETYNDYLKRVVQSQTEGFD